MGFAVRLPFQLEQRIAPNHDPVDHLTVSRTTIHRFSLGASEQLNGVNRRYISRRRQHGILVDGGINQYWLDASRAQRREPRR